MQALFRLWALLMSSVTSILLQNFAYQQHKYLSVHFRYRNNNSVNMRENKIKRVEKYITLHAVSEKTLPQSSWPITTLATLA